jgi:hypothetical protein
MSAHHRPHLDTNLEEARMRSLIPLSVFALAALAAGAYSFAQPSGGGASAFALVDPSGPVLVGDHTSGFASVRVGPFGPGDYCLTPAPGVNVAGTAAVASEEAFYSDEVGVVTVRYPGSGPTCGANQLEVKTFGANDAGLSDGIAFTVIVP